MPINKHTLTRFVILDELLSSKLRGYSLDELTQKVNEQLGESSITRRQLEMDIQYLEYDSPFMVEIERTPYFYENKNGKVVRGKRLHYAEKGYSIFSKKLTREEQHILSQIINFLGKFEGCPQYPYLDDLQKILTAEAIETTSFIQFDRNPRIADTTTFAQLFANIAEKNTVKLISHTFTEKEIKTEDIISPYLLKEYNRRWYVLGFSKTYNALRIYPLDRIDAVESLAAESYIEDEHNAQTRFEDIIGVTFNEDKPCEKICFWVSDLSCDYVDSKPLHESHKELSAEQIQELRQRYPNIPPSGRIFTIECRENYELIRELMSFGAELFVIYPKHISDIIVKKLQKMTELYTIRK